MLLVIKDKVVLFNLVCMGKEIIDLYRFLVMGNLMKFVGINDLYVFCLYSGMG